MKIDMDDIWLCIDCTLFACNGELPPDADPEREAEITEGAEALGPHLVPDFDTETGKGHREFSSCGCDCCGSHLAGEFHRFATLVEGD